MRLVLFHDVGDLVFLETLLSVSVSYDGKKANLKSKTFQRSKSISPFGNQKIIKKGSRATISTLQHCIREINHEQQIKIRVPVSLHRINLLRR